MKYGMLGGRGPTKKSRNWVLHFTVIAGLSVLALPVSAQTITVTGVASDSAVVTDATAPPVADGPPRSIVTPFKASAPYTRAPLRLLIEDQQPPQMASSADVAIADTVAPSPAPPRATITVSNISFPSTETH